MLSDSAILKKIERQPKRSAGFKQLVRELGLRGEQRRELDERLERMVASGQLLRVDSDRYACPSASSGKNMIVGRLSMHRDGYGFVLPDPKSLGDRFKGLAGNIFIPPPVIGNAMHGDQVLVEVVTIRPDGRAEGRIIRPVNRAQATVVGTFHYGSRYNFVTPSDGKIRQEIMIRKHPLPHRFPPEVLNEAQAVENVIPAPESKKRRDYRSLPIVTIDGETARDFDDAVTVRQLANGNYELQVHIADVAQYVTEANALDQEARLRGTSVYFPDRAVPMLPLELSTDICSLRPHLDRLVLSCVMEIDHRGEVVGYEINEGVIRSAERMTYTDVNAVLEGDSVLRQRYAAPSPVFEQMRDLALILNRKRVRRGSIDFDLPEPVIEFDENGMMKSITRSERNIAHRLIEEFMLAANESVAQYLENKRVAAIYRIHEKPDAKRVYEFEMIAATFGYSLGVGALPIQRMQMKTDRRASRGTGRNVRPIEIPKEVHITPRMYQKLTEKIAGKPEEQILSYLMLRSLKQARYSEVNEGHFALAAPTYTHFTSPIRRYPDLIVHRILKEVLHTSPEKWDGDVPVGVSGATGVSPVGAAQAAMSEGDAITEGHFRRADRDAKKKRPTASEDERRSSHQEPVATPWSKRRDRDTQQKSLEPLGGPIPLEELNDVADESSQSERRADEAERELMEWKKVKFMQDRVGEDFDGLIISVTKFGLFVELTDLFVEGMDPLNTLTDDHYVYHETTREIIGQRTRKTYRLGQPVHVILDRIDPVEKKLQFALLEEAHAAKKRGKRR